MDWLIAELEQLLRRARAEQRAANAAERYQRTLHHVEGYLAAHPDATGAEVCRSIKARRGDVLSAIRQVRVPR